MTHVYQPHAGGFAYFTSGVINGAIGVGGTWTAYSTLTLPAYTLGGTVTSNGQSFSGTIANLGTVTTVDLNGGTIDGTIIGGAVPAAGTFTTAAATTGNITTVNATTVDATNIEVTNLKAKDGTAAGSIADATGVVTLASSVLTTTDINAGTIDGTTQASGTINGPIAAGGTWTAAAAWTLPAFTLGGTVTSNGQSFSGVIQTRATSGAFGSIVSIGEANEDAQIAAVGYGIGPVFHGWVAAGTEASKSAVTSGSLTLGIGSRGWDGTQWQDHSAAALHWVAVEDYSSTAWGTEIRVLTTPAGSVTRAQCAVFQGANLGIGTTSPQKRLTVSNSGAEGFEVDPVAYSGGVRMLTYNRGTSAYIPARWEASQHEFHAGGAERAILTSSALTLASGVGITVPGNAAAGNYYPYGEGVSSAFTFGFSTSAGPAFQLWGTSTANAGALLILTAGTERSRFTDSGLAIGTSSFGAGAAKVLSIGTGTAPTTGPADTVQFYSSDDAEGHTIPSFFCEGTNVVATGQADSASSVRIKMRIQGTVYTLLAI